MLKNDAWIREQAAKGMIAPFESSLVRILTRDTADILMHDLGRSRKAISYGLSSYGYDLRLSPEEFRIFQHVPGTVVNPKDFKSENLRSLDLHEDTSGQFFILPAHTYGLGFCLEKLEIPENITCLFIGKSTYARCGIIANLTPGEAGWRGHLTIEISNASSADCRIYANEGIVQALFFEGEPCETTYEARQGKYQDQPATIVTARL